MTHKFLRYDSETNEVHPSTEEEFDVGNAVKIYYYDRIGLVEAFNNSGEGIILSGVTGEQATILLYNMFGLREAAK